MDTPPYGPTMGPPRVDGTRHSLYKTWREIEDVEEQIRGVIEDIEKSNALLEKLRETAHELLKTATLTASLLSPAPFQHVPPDIVGEISGYLLPLRLPDQLQPTGGGIWPLTHVCRSWRNALLSFPRFWSSFDVRMGLCGDVPKLELLSTVLIRSANHPLTLDICISDHSIISLLVKHSRRWRQIKLDSGVGPSSLLPLRGQLPQLEKLHLSLRRRLNSEPPRAMVWLDSNEERSIFQDAPKLTDLTLEAAPHTSDGTCVKLGFPLRQLQRVHYSERPFMHTPFFTLDDLLHFSSVTHLHLDVSYPSVWIGTITLPAVTSLGLGSTLILNVLQLPSLKILEFFRVHFDESDLSDIEAFLTEHTEGSTEWALDGLVVTSARPTFGFIEILSHVALRNLHTFRYRCDSSLTLREWEGMSDLLCLLIWMTPHMGLTLLTKLPSPRLRTNVMPHLQNLFLTFSAEETENLFDLLRDVIVSRTHSVDPKIALAGPSSTISIGHHDRVDLAKLEPAPARLQDFCIDYNHRLRAVTMKDLGDVVEGKFAVGS